jgi:hypothetical protein
MANMHHAKSITRLRRTPYLIEAACYAFFFFSFLSNFEKGYKHSKNRKWDELPNNKSKLKILYKKSNQITRNEPKKWLNRLYLGQS